MMKKVSWYCMFLIFMVSGFVSLYGQGVEAPDFFEQNFAPSPTVSAFQKYNLVNVNLNTGTPGIGIPLYNVQHKDLSIPISLSYHASGVKVKDVASWVGMGWSLNVGGVISRTVVGLPDDVYKIKRGEFNTYLDAGYLYNGDFPETLSNKEPKDYTTTEKDALEKNYKDVGPDIFHFNFGGYSGRFVFDKDGKVKVYSEQDLLIEPTKTTARIDAFVPHVSGSYIEGAITEFKVTTPKGIVYIFNVPEASGNYSYKKDDAGRPFSTDCNPRFGEYGGEEYTPKGPSFDGELAYSSWYLSKIISPNGNGYSVIDFTYEDEFWADHNISSQEFKLNDGATSSSDGKSFSALNVGIKKRLSKIEWEYGSVDFVAEENRNDLYFWEPIPADYYAKGLSRIDIKGSEGGILKTFEFKYGYFEKTELPCSDIPDWLQAHRERLRLESITEKNGSISLPPFSFTYDDTPLPPRHSMQQDYWGYYNGNEATNLLSKIYAYPDDDHTYYRSMYSVYPRLSYDGEEHIIDGNDRSPNENFIQAGVLTKIKYPAGGSTLFEFEPNRFQFNETKFTYGNQPFLGAGLRIKKITDHDGISINNDVIKEYDYNYLNNGKCSGKLIDPSFFAKVYKVSRLDINSELVIDDNISYYTKLTSGSTCNSGSRIMYEEVSVLYNENGKTRNQYSVPATYSEGIFKNHYLHANGRHLYEAATYESGEYTPFYEYGNYLCVDNPNYNWNRGKILSQSTYAESGSLLKQTSFAYKLRNYEKIPGIKAFSSRIIQPSGDKFFLVVGKYYHLLAFQYLNSKETKTYYPTGTVSVKSDYTYGSDHTMPLEVVMNNSDGKEHKTITEYPQNVSGLPADTWLANTRMLKLKMFHFPIRIKRYVEGNLIGGQENYYKIFNGTDGELVLPHQSNEIYDDGSSRNILSLDFHPDGNVNTIKSLGQPKESYTWQSDLLRKKSILDWTWKYDYYSNSRLVQSITDLNDIVSTFEYDDLQRLEKSTGRNGGLFNTFDYNYTLSAGGTKNHVKTYDGALKQWTYGYFDGLGRDLQSVSKQYSPDHRDVVNGGLYDSFGRMNRQYLPYEGGGSGAYVDPYGPFTKYTFDNSPLSREVLRTFADNTTISTTHLCNTGGEVTGYNSATLYKQLSIDENGNKTETFTDKIGQLILTRRYVNGGEKVDTYNKYDDRGNLEGVMPPETSSIGDPAAYKYSYDIYNRLTEKKIPGAGVQSFTYNTGTGTVLDDKINNSADANGNTLVYSYDDYGRQKTIEKDGTVLIHNTYDEGSGASEGKLTKEEVANLGDGGGSLGTSYHYDNIGRLITTNVQNHQGGADGFTSSYYGATDIVENSTKIHNGYIKIRERYTYDHSFRLKQTWNKINYDPWVLLSEQGYNHRDELIGKGIGGEHERFLQSIGYGYNVRGWLTNINSLPLDHNGPIIENKDACDPSIEIFTATSECGIDIGLEQLLKLRQLDNINLDCFDPCTTISLVAIADGLVGDAEDVELQNASLEVVENQMAEMSLEEIVFPTQLFRVQLYQEEKILFEEELNNISGDYFVEQCQEVPGIESPVGIEKDGEMMDKTIGELLEMRITNTPIFTNPTCDVSCDLICTETQRRVQNESVRIFADYVSTVSASTISYPTSLHYIELCSGEKIYILTDEFSRITGRFLIHQKIPLYGPSQTLEIIDFTGRRNVNLTTLLALRAAGTPFFVEGEGCDVNLNTSSEDCTFSISHENWAYENIENSREIKVTYDQVVTRTCGAETTEMKRTPVTEMEESTRKNSLNISGNGLSNLGYIDKLHVKTLNPEGELIIDLNPGTVFGSYPGLPGYLTTAYFYRGQGVGGLSNFRNALRITIEHAIEKWSIDNNLGEVTYDWNLEMGQTSTGAGTLLMSFYVRHNPSGPYINLEEGVSTLYYYDGWPPSIRKEVSAVAEIDNPYELSDNSYSTPCGNIDITFEDQLVDVDIKEWSTLTLVNPDPPVVPSTNGFPATIFCPQTEVVNGINATCDYPIYIWKGYYLQSCPPRIVDNPFPNSCPTVYNFAPIEIQGSDFFYEAGLGTVPAQDLTALAPGGELSFFSDGQSWTINDPEYGEASWNLEVPSAILNSIPDPFYEVKIDIPVFDNIYLTTGGHVKFGLYYGNTFIPVNGGQDYVFVREAGEVILTPDITPSITQMEGLKLMILTNFGGTLSIDAVSIDLTDDPCKPGEPVDPVGICSFTESMSPKGMAPAETFSSSFNVAPYNNLLTLAPGFTNSYLDDGNSWDIYPMNGPAEAEYDIGFLTNSSTPIEVTSYEVLVDVATVHRKASLKLGLSIDGELIELEGGNYYLQLTETSNQAIHSLIPAELPSDADVQEIQLAILVGIAGGNGNNSEVTHTAISNIDVNIEYKKLCEACYVPQPNCSPADYIAQAESLIEVRAAMASVDYNTLNFPIELRRVTLCGGDVLYLFENEIALLAGNYLVDQVLSITNAYQIFTVRSHNAATGGNATGEPGLEIPDLFGMEFHYYDENERLHAPAQYNGNIAWTQWQVKGKRANYYGYRYDELDRLKKATFGEDFGNQGMIVSNRYTVDGPEQYIKYDQRGNIEDLRRRGGFGGCNDGGYNFDIIDQLEYKYEGGANQLTTLTDVNKDAGGIRYLKSEFKYDFNGNLIEDQGKNISEIKYNHLNLPEEITFNQGGATGVIKFAYDAKGTKQVKTVNGAVVKEYLPSGVEYDGDKIEAIYHAEGRAIPMYNSEIPTLIDSFRYEYVIRDHLGNGRVYFSDKNEDSQIQIGGLESEIMQENHYYPFGLNHEGPFYPTQPTQNQYQFNDTELNEEFGLNWNFTLFRTYDAAIGRWMQVDQLAEFAPDWNPYRFGFDNPVLFVDPFGLFETELQARDHAKEKGIKVGFFRNNKIREQKDGSFAIENKREGSFTAEYTIGQDADGNDIKSVIKGSLVSDKDVVDIGFEGEGFDAVMSKEHRDGSTSEEKLLKGGTIDVGPGKIPKGYTYVKTIGKKFDVFQKTKKATKLNGQARAVYTKIKNRMGKTVRFFKDAFKRDGRHYERANYKPTKTRSRKLD